MQGIVKKKLCYLQGIVINRSFVTNRVELPAILLPISEKNITLDHITVLSNIARLMTPPELSAAVETALKTEENDKVK